MLIYAFDSVIRFKKSRDLHDIHVRHKIVHTDVHVHAMCTSMENTCCSRLNNMRLLTFLLES